MSSLPENLSNALELYGQAKAISQHVKPLSAQKASVLIVIARDAIKEFGSTNQEKKDELEKLISEAEHVLPPKTIEELRKRAEGHVLEKAYPKKPILRKAVLTIIGLAIVSSIALVYLRNALPFLFDDDPLGIKGRWTYTTTLQNEDNPEGINGVAAVIGYNSIEISSDRIGYTIEGYRTHYRLVGSTEPIELKPHQKITLSRVSYSADKKSFFFYFSVSSDGKQGFADMDIGERTAAMIKGEIHYLVPSDARNRKGTWYIAEITFVKQ